MVHLLEKQQLVNSPRQELWNFISAPNNLAVITPEYMDFQILNRSLEPRIYPGQIIRYKVSPLLGIKLNWVTEITHVREGEYFVDEQRQGPYVFWHHQHQLIPMGDRTLMKDIVHYKIGFGPFGKLINGLVVRNQVEEIFEFRRKKLIQVFGE